MNREQKTKSQQRPDVTALLSKDLLLDVLAEAERGGGAVVPLGTEAVVRRS